MDGDDEVFTSCMFVRDQLAWRDVHKKLEGVEKNLLTALNEYIEALDPEPSASITEELQQVLDELSKKK